MFKKYQKNLSPLEQLELKKICDVAKWLDDRNAIPATSSNFSYKNAENSFFITRSGMHKRDIAPAHFLSVDMHGNALSRSFIKPSDETLLHAMIYRNFPNARAVLHCHAREFEKAMAPSYTLVGHELLKAVGLKTHTEDLVIPVFKNNQDMHALSEEIQSYYLKTKHPNHFAFILEHHGVYCFGSSVDRARYHLEVLLHLNELGRDQIKGNK